MSPTSVRAALTNLWPRSGGARIAVLAAVGGLLMMLALSALLTPAAATPPAVVGSPFRAPETAAWPLGVDIIAKLVAVIALIYATAAVARRYLLRAPSFSRSAVRVLDTTSLAPKKSVYLLEIGSRVLVVGSTESSLSILAEFTDPEEVAALVARTRSSGPAFQRYLDFSMGRGRLVDSAAGDQPVSFVERALGRRPEGDR